jgi:hypothetical protein
VAIAAYHIDYLEFLPKGKLWRTGSRQAGRSLCMLPSRLLDSDMGILLHRRGTIKMYAIIFFKNIYLKQSKMVLRIIKSRNDLHIVLDIIIKRSIVIIIEVLLCKS